jgi:hypothetical protein
MNASTTRRPLLVLSTALLLTGALAACGSSVRARTGYIPRSVQMAEVNDMTQEWRGGARIADFTSVTVAEVATPNTGAYGDISDEKLAEVRTALQKALSEELAQLKPSGAGGRTLVVRAAVTAIKPNNPLLNVAPQTQILKRGYGYASCEIYATDGEAGPVVAAFMQTSDTQRLSTEKYSDTGTAERASKDWAKAFRELIAR